MSTYFLDPFEFPYYFYRIRGELIYVLSIVVCIPSTFCPTLGHHQGRIYYKSDVTFVLAYYHYVRASLPLKIMVFAFKYNLVKFSKTFLFQAIQFTQTIQFSISMLLVLFNPQIGPYQVLPLRARVDLGAMAMKRYTAFPEAPALLGPHHQIVYCHIQVTR